MFHYKALPAEIRLKILPTLLEPQPNKGVPAILVALYKDPELYAEAQELYRTINVVISIKNQAEFRKVKMVDLLKIRCLKLLMQPDRYNTRVDLGANKCLLRNNFQALIFECSIQGTDTYWIELTRYLSGASEPGITKVVAILSTVPDSSNLPVDGPCRRAETIERATREIGVTGTCVMLGAREIWTWEKEGGGVLDIGEAKRERDRERGRDTGDIGGSGSEGLKRMSSMTRALALRGKKE